MKHFGIAILSCLLWLTSEKLFSQDSSLVKPLLLITTPHQSDTVNYARLRIAGCTRQGATVTVNKIPVKVYRSGAFVDLIQLSPRMNTFEISAADSIGDTTAVFNIFREPPLPVSPTKPTEIDQRIVWPDEDILLISGDILEVRFKGSPGGTAKFKIDKLCKNVPMTELKPADGLGMVGIYGGVIKLNTGKKIESVPVEFELRGSDGKKVRAKSAGKVTVLPDDIPLVGETNDRTYLKATPYGLTVMTLLPKGVRLLLAGKIGGNYKVQLTESKFAFVPEEEVTVLPAGTPLPKTSISLPSLSSDRDWLQLKMSISTPCVFTVNQSLDPAQLELIVYGARLAGKWTTYPDNDSTIKMIRWQQPSGDEFKLMVDLNQKQQWGHRVRFEPGQMILEIRRAPKIAAPPNSPVAGLIFAVDAGHGGVELGAVGATGLMEKDVNLIYSKKLAALLDSAGAKVLLTRTEDVQMSLAARVDTARAANAHIFCWMHNNGVGSSSDAARVRGTSTYFTVPQNQDLAWTVYPHLLQLGLEPYGRIQSDYYMTRQTDMLVVLVEGAFMSHPEDEMLLMDDKFLDRLARAVFNGLEDFCRKQADN